MTTTLETSFLLCNPALQSCLPEDAICSTDAPATFTGLQDIEDPVHTPVIMTRPGRLETSPGMLGLFIPRSTSSHAATPPTDYYHMSSDQLARENARYFDDLRQRREDAFKEKMGYLASNMEAGRDYPLDKNYDLLPDEVFETVEQYARATGKRASEISFSFQWVMSEDGSLTPHINFGDAPRDDRRTRSSGEELLMAGALMGGPGSSFGFMKRLRSFEPIPWKQMAFKVGVSTGLFMTVNWAVDKANIPEPLKMPATFAGSAFLYETLYQTSVTTKLGLFAEQPAGARWSAIGGGAIVSMPIGLGSALVFDKVGLPIGSTGNLLASTVTTIGVYEGAAYLGSQIPTLAAAYGMASTGTGLTPIVIGGTTLSTAGGGVFVAGGGVAGGMGVGGAALSGALAIAATITGAMIGGGLFELGTWLLGMNDDPAYRLTRAAYDSLLSEAYGWGEGTFGQVCNGTIGKVFQGIQWIGGLFDDDIDTEIWSSVATRIDQWAGKIESVADIYDEGLSELLLEAMDKDSKVDWNLFEKKVSEMFANIPYKTKKVYFEQVELFGHRTPKANAIKRMLDLSGEVRSPEARAELRKHMDALVPRLLKTRSSQIDKGFAAVGMGAWAGDGTFHYLAVPEDKMTYKQTDFVHSSQYLQWKADSEKLMAYLERSQR